MAALLAAGCGDSRAEENTSAAREAAERYVEALREGDAGAACEVLSRGAIDELEDRADAPCPEALTVALGAGGEAGEELGELRLTEVNVAGDVATATIRGGPGGEVTNQMVRERGEWKLAAPGG